jgi:hypothetical protein|tara:strand:+ start:302 stop:481 length:180 start_codon:yes stop_codon:yes gene_type:complete
MLVRGMNIPLIIACTTIVIALLIFPLIVSYKAEKNKDENELNKIKKYRNKINNKTRKNK